MLADYDISILCHLGKVNMVVDALSQKTVNMGNLAHLVAEEWLLALDLHFSGNRFVRLDILDVSWVLAFIGDQSSLLDQIWARQFEDASLLCL